MRRRHGAGAGMWTGVHARRRGRRRRAAHAGGARPRRGVPGGRPGPAGRLGPADPARRRRPLAAAPRGVGVRRPRDLPQRARAAARPSGPALGGEPGDATRCHVGVVAHRLRERGVQRRRRGAHPSGGAGGRRHARRRGRRGRRPDRPQAAGPGRAQPARSDGGGHPRPAVHGAARPGRPAAAVDVFAGARRDTCRRDRPDSGGAGPLAGGHGGRRRGRPVPTPIRRTSSWRRRPARELADPRGGRPASPR